MKWFELFVVCTYNVNEWFRGMASTIWLNSSCIPLFQLEQNILPRSNAKFYADDHYQFAWFYIWHRGAYNQYTPVVYIEHWYLLQIILLRFRCATCCKGEIISKNQLKHTYNMRVGSRDCSVCVLLSQHDFRQSPVTLMRSVMHAQRWCPRCCVVHWMAHELILTAATPLPPSHPRYLVQRVHAPP